MSERTTAMRAGDDPLARRMIGAAVISAAYGGVWWFGLFRPLNPWVNAAIVAAVLLCTLPPARVRPFVGGVALLGLAAVMHFEVRLTLTAIVLVVFGLLSLADGVFGLRGRVRPGD